ncbi:hypothetical protein K432DRAFT_225 [Lepidopterella palustris CBS 459.81]|uniref:Uncharacterized protein n=1 Tax=Lepidopterella palustris CBS 459.81 TaxID=1314670 RepID=A0A8E2ELR7_9PEZI|nr:hypothetical protein K432DRAFT_225 [Lepidopterella palustris CBS 459.81]
MPATAPCSNEPHREGCFGFCAGALILGTGLISCGAVPMDSLFVYVGAVVLRRLEVFIVAWRDGCGAVLSVGRRGLEGFKD